VWIDPPTEFSIGSTARSASHWLSAWKATSNCSHGSGSPSGTALSAAPSLYAPGAPWYATRARTAAGAASCAPAHAPDQAWAARALARLRCGGAALAAHRRLRPTRRQRRLTVNNAALGDANRAAASRRLPARRCTAWGKAVHAYAALGCPAAGSTTTNGKSRESPAQAGYARAAHVVDTQLSPWSARPGAAPQQAPQAAPARRKCRPRARSPRSSARRRARRPGRPPGPQRPRARPALASPGGPAGGRPGARSAGARRAPARPARRRRAGRAWPSAPTAPRRAAPPLRPPRCRPAGRPRPPRARTLRRLPPAARRRPARRGTAGGCACLAQRAQPCVSSQHC